MSNSDTRHLPRIVFQTWKSRTILPSNYAYWRSTFFLHNPDHKILLWDDDDNRAFIATYFPWFLERYNSYPFEIYRADIVRLFFLYRYGGLYADMDSECLRPITAMTLSGDVVLGLMGADTTFEHSMPNAIMASRPGQAFWLTAISLACDRIEDWAALKRMSASPGATPRTGPEYMTGPILLRDAFMLYQRTGHDNLKIQLARFIPRDLIETAQFGTIDVLQPRACYAVDWNNPFHRVLTRRMRKSKRVLAPDVAARLFSDASVVTYWSHSW